VRSKSKPIAVEPTCREITAVATRKKANAQDDGHAQQQDAARIGPEGSKK
jgi:hypothetical protein